ncbi:hypothetical protein BFP71_00530 [Roseivirga misakiensis]|uniref:PhoD-like phosphatase metallophosphatase domain-containing protein n=2 Tax=Roseivirga misakiensis TaxID=1563681 RepID=A0A1E5T757_9BACT|nr:hypothetical protein BFP71_00530 [Roseivirga misakiensis]
MRRFLLIGYSLCSIFALASAQDINSQVVLQNIAIGSCNRQEAPQVIWPEVLKTNPDLWIWLGDNIYGDSEDMDVIKAKYDKQKNNSAYRELLKQVPVIGIWDDHDYGKNDAGQEFSQKVASRDLMFDFLDVPKQSPAWERKGGYQSYTYGSGNKKVKILLLDARYFRGNLDKKDRIYVKNLEGTVLGEEQWQWLENELTNSDAAIHILASGIQFIADQHPFEKWDNFPKERQRLLDLLVKTQPKNAFFLSGDRHISEIAQLDVPGYGRFYDFTSSGMTHSYSSSTESNTHRVSKLITEKSFGVIKIDWSKPNPIVALEMRGVNGELLDKPVVLFGDN